ncbi:hypothetical protein GcM3_207053 [Golovinomyces cichoracearum]|uniref:Uncharacterized protein n=1 Tax=Golovinomyces cichoracearum TaxID=62708 RepID=A0A420HBA0_9PEZI|nr:hypothetical protein GcM3_207053 [Golovinomyces cichoracearum]
MVMWYFNSPLSASALSSPVGSPKIVVIRRHHPLHSIIRSHPLWSHKMPGLQSKRALHLILLLS